MRRLWPSLINRCHLEWWLDTCQEYWTRQFVTWNFIPRLLYKNLFFELRKCFVIAKKRCKKNQDFSLHFKTFGRGIFTDFWKNREIEKVVYTLQHIMLSIHEISYISVKPEKPTFCPLNISVQFYESSLYSNGWCKSVGFESVLESGREKVWPQSAECIKSLRQPFWWSEI